MKQFVQKLMVFTAGVLSLAVAQAQLPAQVDNAALPSLAPIIKRASPAVVGIAVRGKVREQAMRNPLFEDPFFRRFFDIPNDQQPPEREYQAAGSGVIVDASAGYIITNAHVVKNASDITITLLDNREIKAQIKGVDEASDIAVLQVKPERLVAIPLADSNAVQVGDFVIAIGNPFGLQHTVTSGIISALGRAPGISRDGYEDFIQTDASINPGNSGGALLNLRGELVGINSAIFSNSGGNIGIGFAIPTNMAKTVMDQLVKNGKVVRGELGVRIQTLPTDLAGSLGAAGTEGVLVSQVMEGSAADKAGIKPGDIITNVNNKPIKTGQSLRNTIGFMAVGEKIEIGIMRDGKPRKITAIIGEQSAHDEEEASDIHDRLGGAALSDNGNNDGVLITAVADNSNAARLGLKSNDVIIGVGNIGISNLKQLRDTLKNVDSFLLRIRRGNRMLVVIVR